jgi:glycosyltransferase involved in cell wall biosynthesis
MERYVLQAAHVLLPPSSSIQSLYELAYGLSSERMLISPPPMDSILANLHLLVASNSLLEPSSASLGGEGGNFKLLVYGREGKMAGAATAASAAPLLQSLLPASTKLHLVFMGTDWRQTTNRASFSEAVRGLLPAGFSGKVDFLEPVERDGALLELCRTVHGAVVASEFETTGLIAHKLAALGVPLVISDIPAFAEFFTAGSAYTFQAGNATDLSTAAARLFEDLLEGRRSALRLSRVKYANPVNPYARLLELAREGTPSSLVDVRMTEVGISRLELR